jgi:amino acid permease
MTTTTRHHCTNEMSSLLIHTTIGTNTSNYSSNNTTCLHLQQAPERSQQQFQQQYETNCNIDDHVDAATIIIGDSTTNDTTTTTTTIAGANISSGTSTKSTFLQTVLNLAKTCMGTGCLALPYSCQNSGILLYCLGMIFIAIWNIYCVYLLNDCYNYTKFINLVFYNSNSTRSCHHSTEQQQQHNYIDYFADNENHLTMTDDYFPSKHKSDSFCNNDNDDNDNDKHMDKNEISSIPISEPSTTIGACRSSNSSSNNIISVSINNKTNMLGYVAWTAFGQRGLYGIDTCQITLLLGITISYVSAIITFLLDVIKSTSSSSSIYGSDMSFVSSQHEQQSAFIWKTSATSSSSPFETSPETSVSPATRASTNVNTTMDMTTTINFIEYERIVCALVTFLILGSICVWVPNLTTFSKISASGLFVLTLSLLVIALYGVLYDYNTSNISSSSSTSSYIEVSQQTTTTRVGSLIDVSSSSINILPTSWIGICNWYGIAVFGYGTVPLTYNFQQSMQQPHRIVTANCVALIGVALFYLLVGIGLYILFPSVQDDILHVLPNNGIIPLTLRIAMILIVLSTAPLIAIPCSDLIEQKVLATEMFCRQQHFEDNGNSNINNTINNNYGALNWYRNIIRLGLIGFCTTIAATVPGFVQVLSFVGCFCVATVSFCMPPLLHVRLMWLIRRIESSSKHKEYNINYYHYLKQQDHTSDNKKYKQQQHHQQQQPKHNNMFPAHCQTTIENDCCCCIDKIKSVIFSFLSISSKEEFHSPQAMFKFICLSFFDISLLVLGIAATLLSTFTTLRQIHIQD